MEHTDRNRASADLFPFADAEDTYWRNEFRTRPYVRPGVLVRRVPRRLSLRLGIARGQQDRQGVGFDQQRLERGWEKAKRSSRLAWSEAKEAVRDGWHHVEKAMPGDFDKDGR